MAAKKETYSQAMERLEKIVRQIDNNELDIDILSEKIKEAKSITSVDNCLILSQSHRNTPYSSDVLDIPVVDRKSTRLNSSH